MRSDAAVMVGARLSSERDVMLRISDQAVHVADLRLAVANVLVWLVDVLAHVTRPRQTQADASLTVVGVVDRRADVCLKTIDPGLVRADTALTVMRPVFLAADEELVTLRRLSPNMETKQMIYAVLIRESHPIQV